MKGLTPAQARKRREKIARRRGEAEGRAQLREAEAPALVAMGKAMLYGAKRLLFRKFRIDTAGLRVQARPEAVVAAETRARELQEARTRKAIEDAKKRKAEREQKERTDAGSAG